MHNSTLNFLESKTKTVEEEIISMQSVKVKTQFLHLVLYFCEKTMKSLKFVRRSRRVFFPALPPRQRKSKGKTEGVKKGWSKGFFSLGVGSEELIPISTC